MQAADGAMPDAGVGPKLRRCTALPEPLQCTNSIGARINFPSALALLAYCCAALSIDAPPLPFEFSRNTCRSHPGTVLDTGRWYQLPSPHDATRLLHKRWSRVAPASKETHQSWQGSWIGIHSGRVDSRR